jgi:hypothetical protein
MTDVRCPKCGKRAHFKRYARPAGILIGGATGWINGWQAAAQTAQLVLRCAGPYGAIAGQIAGVIFVKEQTLCRIRKNKNTSEGK